MKNQRLEGRTATTLCNAKHQVFFKLTWLGGEDAHEAREKGMNRPQNFRIATGHTCSDPSLERLEMGQDGGRLQHRQQEAENLQSGADVRDVRLRWLFLRRYRMKC